MSKYKRPLCCPLSCLFNAQELDQIEPDEQEIVLTGSCMVHLLENLAFIGYMVFEVPHLHVVIGLSTEECKLYLTESISSTSVPLKHLEKLFSFSSKCTKVKDFFVKRIDTYCFHEDCEALSSMWSNELVSSQKTPRAARKGRPRTKSPEMSAEAVETSLELPKMTSLSPRSPRKVTIQSYFHAVSVGAKVLFQLRGLVSELAMGKIRSGHEKILSHYISATIQYKSKEFIVLRLHHFDIFVKLSMEMFELTVKPHSNSDTSGSSGRTLSSSTSKSESWFKVLSESVLLDMHDSVEEADKSVYLMLLRFVNSSPHCMTLSDVQKLLAVREPNATTATPTIISEVVGSDMVVYERQESQQSQEFQQTQHQGGEGEGMQVNTTSTQVREKFLHCTVGKTVLFSLRCLYFTHNHPVSADIMSEKCVDMLNSYALHAVVEVTTGSHVILKLVHFDISIQLTPSQVHFGVNFQQTQQTVLPPNDLSHMAVSKSRVEMKFYTLLSDIVHNSPRRIDFVPSQLTTQPVAVAATTGVKRNRDDDTVTGTQAIDTRSDRVSYEETRREKRSRTIGSATIGALEEDDTAAPLWPVRPSVSGGIAGAQKKSKETRELFTSVADTFTHLAKRVRHSPAQQLLEQQTEEQGEVDEVVEEQQEEEEQETQHEQEYILVSDENMGSHHPRFSFDLLDVSLDTDIVGRRESSDSLSEALSYFSGSANDVEGGVMENEVSEVVNEVVSREEVIILSPSSDVYHTTTVEQLHSLFQTTDSSASSSGGRVVLNSSLLSEQVDFSKCFEEELPAVEEKE